MTRPTIARTFVILSTQWVSDPIGEPPYWEIKCGADQDPGTPSLVILTRDDLLIALALELEGSDTRVMLTWHQLRQARRRRPHLELDTLAEVH